MASGNDFFVQSCLGLLAAYTLFSVIRFSLLSLRPKNFPPGPSALPFIGNVHHFASPKPFFKFTEWRKTYGDIIGLKAGPGNIVVLNSAEASRELLEKRGAIYSGRPDDYIPREHIVHGAQHILFLQNDAYLKQWRTAVRYLLGPAGAEQILPLQDAAAAFLAYSLASTPEKFQDHLHNWGLGTPLNAICGHRGAAKEPSLIKLFYDNQEKWLNLLTPGLAPPVDMFPILKYMPEFMAKWKQQARELHNNQRGFYYMMLDSAKEERKRYLGLKDTEQARYESLMARLLREQGGKAGFDDHQLAYLGGGLLDAAVDTTYISALNFVKVMGAFPEVQRRAQAEVDNICGADRPPQPHDLEKLRYLKACFFEILRWRPAVPVNLPHVLEADDTFGGWRIPKGTVVLQNSWGILHDPEIYESPESFNPERYLENPYGTKQSAEECRAEGRKTTYTFGGGRRQCPGDLFAQNSFLMMAAKVIWTFDVIPKKPLDTSVETGFHGGLALGPEPFEVDFISRSDNHRRIIVQDYEKTKFHLE